MIMTEITTIQTFLEAVVKAQLVVGCTCLVRSEKEVTFDDETLVPDCTLLDGETPFDCGIVLGGQAVFDVETLG